MKIAKFLFILTIIISLNACTEEFEDLNTRPDVLIADKVDAGLLGQALAKAQYASMHGEHWRFQISENLFSDLYCQYFATTASNFDSDRYVEVGRWIDLAWSSFYGEAAPQIKFVEDLSAKNNLKLENAIAKVWKVQAYHRQTDYWGPIIYSKYGNGETTVPYDNQEAIYKSFFATLDEATTALKATGTVSFGSNDLIYSGNAAQWLKFANSLRLRLALRVKYVDPGLAKTQAEKAVADGVITANADNAFIKTNPNTLNPFTTITDWGEFRMSALMESVLKGYGDPRLAVYFNPAVDGDSDGDGNPYEGLRNGQLKVDKTPKLNSAHSDMNTTYLPLGAKGGKNPPHKVMSASEIAFLRAEGALEGWNMGGTAQKFYEDGISLSMTETTTATAAQITAYTNSAATPVSPVAGVNPSTNIPIKFDAAGSKERQLEQIITQKWIGLFPDGWEAFAEVRRTGYPKLIPIIASDNPDLKTNDIFRRMTFVTSEYSNNKAATDAAAALAELTGKGGNKNSTRVWWDKK
jgi:hypothetical protein